MRRSLVATVVLVTLLAATAAAACDSTTTKPALRVLRTTPLVVQGTSFAPRTTVVVTALTGVGPRIVRTRTTARGTFKAVFRSLAQPCGKPFAVRARIASGQVAVVRLAAQPCVPPPIR